MCWLSMGSTVWTNSMPTDSNWCSGLPQDSPLEHINGFTPESMHRMAAGLGFAEIALPTPHVTVDPLRVIRGEVKRLIGGFLKPTTRMYFLKI